MMADVTLCMVVDNVLVFPVHIKLKLKAEVLEKRIISNPGLNLD